MFSSTALGFWCSAVWTATVRRTSTGWWNSTPGPVYVRDWDVATPALLCYKDTAQASQSPLLVASLAFHCVFMAEERNSQSGIKVLFSPCEPCNHPADPPSSWPEPPPPTWPPARGTSSTSLVLPASDHSPACWAIPSVRRHWTSWSGDRDTWQLSTL